MGAGPLATNVSWEAGLPLKLARKENKAHGVAGGVGDMKDSVFLVEDVVTTATSLLDIANRLEEEGHTVVGAACLVDRRAMNEPLLTRRGTVLRLQSVFTLYDVVRCLIEENEHGWLVKDLLVGLPRKPPLVQRPLSHEGARAVVAAAHAKRTLLCWSADLSSWDAVKEMLPRLAGYLCMVKVHPNTFSPAVPRGRLVRELRTLCSELDLVWMLDDKFGDIGAVTAKQLEAYSAAPPDLATVHALPGPSTTAAVAEADVVSSCHGSPC